MNEAKGRVPAAHTRSQSSATSRQLSYWLRHAPEAGGLSLDEAGWVPTKGVIRALCRSGFSTTASDLDDLVANSEKQRFELSPDGMRIRARQGHSIDVNAGWPITKPPENLFHGTVEKYVASILEHGLSRQARHHVHLSEDLQTAEKVGSRRGRAVILEIAARKMVREGSVFRLSSNGVWLVDHVPPKFLRRLAD